ncbi:hypothetical protein ACJX0J_022594, partial [Zea mays]
MNFFIINMKCIPCLTGAHLKPRQWLSKVPLKTWDDKSAGLICSKFKKINKKNLKQNSVKKLRYIEKLYLLFDKVNQLQNIQNKFQQAWQGLVSLY